MSQRYFTNEAILSHAELIGPIRVWPPGMEALQRSTDALRDKDIKTWTAFWPDGTFCVLFFPVAQERPRDEQIVRSYRAYHTGMAAMNAATSGLAS